MTFSQRRRLIFLVRELVCNAAVPFLLGVVLAYVLSTSLFIDIFTSLDRSALGVCIQPNGGPNA